jgi:nicotinic acid mononucleotide adenylyltransferase
MPAHGVQQTSLLICRSAFVLLPLLLQRGYDVWGCYMSPVADAYGKEGLAPVQHRLQMCQLAAADTSNVMVDSWEAKQQGYTRTVQVGVRRKQKLSCI